MIIYSEIFNFLQLVKYFSSYKNILRIKNILFLKEKYFFSLHLGIQSGPCEEQLVRLDEQCNEKTYKVKLNSTPRESISFSRNCKNLLLIEYIYWVSKKMFHSEKRSLLAKEHFFWDTWYNHKKQNG